MGIRRDNIETMLVVASVIILCLLSPDSIRFVTEQLFPSWQHFGEEILKLDLNPFGKANFTESGSAWDFTCQHGPDECRGNKVQACILDKVSDPKEYVPLINCLMDAPVPPDAAGECIASLGTESVTIKEVEDCANSDSGASLLHDIGVKTKDLDPPLTFVPWLVYNDVYNAQDMAEGLTNLTKVLCCNYLQGGDKCAGYNC